MPFPGRRPGVRGSPHGGEPPADPGLPAVGKYKKFPPAPKKRPQRAGPKEQAAAKGKRGERAFFPAGEPDPERKNGGKRDPPSFIIDAKDPPRKRKRHFPQPENAFLLYALAKREPPALLGRVKKL